MTEVTNEVMALDPYFRVVMDSLDFFTQREDPSRVIGMIRMLQAHTQMYRGLLFITVSNDGLPPAVKQELSQIADMVLSFKVRTIGTDFETSMIVSKFRNSPENLKFLFSVLLRTKRSLRNGRAYCLMFYDEPNRTSKEVLEGGPCRGQEMLL